MEKFKSLQVTNNETKHSNSEMYEGNAPYIFISYSHRDTDSMISICNVFSQSGAITGMTAVCIPGTTGTW